MRNRSNDSNYHWDYQDYRGNYGQSPARARKKQRPEVLPHRHGGGHPAGGALCVGGPPSGAASLPPQPDQDSSIGNELEHLPEIDQQNKPDDSMPEQTEERTVDPPPASIKSAPPPSWASSATAAAPPRRAAASSFRKTATSSPMPMWSAAAKKFEVVLQNGDSYDATVIGADNQSDLALLKMQEPARGAGRGNLRQHDELEVGEMVVAIGNPGGLALASTQTVGYISAVQRTITTELGYTMVCIQADAAINPGNSGGPLINTYGQVVGITSSKLVEEGYEGIGFSIPINTALPILDDLMQHGRVTGQAQLGITVVEVGSNEANYYGIPAGLRIMSINEDSDVGRQGAEVGDIITSIDGWAITSRADCSDILAQHKPGDTVEISLYRASRTGRGQTFTITVTLLGS